MSSGPKNVTSTTNSEPPAYLAGPLSTGAQASIGNFKDMLGLQATDPKYGGIPNLMQSGSRLIGDTLSGSMLSPDSNPYLAQTFYRAADLTRGRLDSEFAGAGRNLGASMPARSEELQTLASNLFGQNYQAERDRQTNALVSAQDYDPVNLLINRLAGITPGAGGKTTSTQPVFRTGLF